MKVFDHLDKLPIFTQVAESGSISAAAKNLALTQPAITRAIQTLERAVGYSLFNRDRYGMHLTEGGRQFLAVSQRTLKEIADAAVRGAHSAEMMSGNITVGTYESLAAYLWPEFLHRIQRDFSSLNVSLKTNSQSGHLTELRQGTLDLLVDAEPRAHAGLTLWPLYSDRFGFYHRRKIDLTPEIAESMSLLFVRGVFDENDVTIDQHLASAGYRFRREYAFDSFTTAKRMAAEEIGVAVLPQRLAGDDLQPLRAKGLTGGFGPHRIYATVSPRSENDPRVKKLVAMLKRQLSERF